MRCKQQIVTVACFAYFAIRLAAGPLDEWTQRYPFPQLRTLIYGGEKFVGLMGIDSVLISTDGENWMLSHIGGNAWDIVYGNGRFAALGQDCIWASSDAITWTRVLNQPIGSPAALEFGNGRFVAAGYLGTFTSEDGRSWTKWNSAAGSLTYADGVFITAPNGNVHLSEDGVHWMPARPWTNRFFKTEFRAMTGGNGMLVAVGKIEESFDVFRGIILLSIDRGKSWSRQDMQGEIAPLSAITFANGLFVAVGEDNTLLTSRDGANWTAHALPGSRDNLNSIACGNGMLIAAGTFGSMHTSHDGTSWTSRGPGSPATLSKIAFGNAQFIAVGSRSNSAVILTSSDGVHWNESGDFTRPGLHGVTAAAPGVFVTVGEGGTVLTSSNSIAWVPRESGTTNSLRDVTFANGKFVAVGVSQQNHEILVSQDAISWQIRETGPDPLYAVAHDGEKFIAVGGKLVRYGGGIKNYGSTILTSHDGESWKLLGTNWGGEFWDIASGAGKLVAVGYTCYPIGCSIGFVSGDPISWSQVDIPLSKAGTGIAFGKGAFLAVGWYGSIAYSMDTRQWTRVNFVTGDGFTGVAYGNGTFVTTTYSGRIFQSGNDQAPRMSIQSRPDREKLRITATGETGRVYQVESSADLLRWRSLAVVTNVATDMEFFDLIPAGSRSRFYRVVSP